MTGKKRVRAITPYEDVYGYSRAIRVGSIIVVSGTTALDAQGEIVAQNDIYAQTVLIIRKIEAALRELGASLNDVVRTRIFTKDISRWQEIAKAHREVFGATKPTATLVEVTNLIEANALVEMEVDAITES